MRKIGAVPLRITDSLIDQHHCGGLVGLLWVYLNCKNVHVPAQRTWGYTCSILIGKLVGVSTSSLTPPWWDVKEVKNL